MIVLLSRTYSMLQITETFQPTQFWNGQILIIDTASEQDCLNPTIRERCMTKRSGILLTSPPTSFQGQRKKPSDTLWTFHSFIRKNNVKIWNCLPPPKKTHHVYITKTSQYIMFVETNNLFWEPNEPYKLTLWMKNIVI